MKKITPYLHRVQYYETDQMKIAHHSNYIRWFEEARTDVLEQAGCGYKEMEELGIISPVLSVSAEYKSMTHFYEVVEIHTKVLSYNGIKLVLAYEVYDQETGEIRCMGSSSHCFLDEKGKPVSLKKNFPKYHELFEALKMQSE